MKIYDIIKEINADYITPDYDQPRKTFRRDTLVELAESIKQSGLINPILAEKIGKNNYKIVVGHRRYEACKIAGLKKIRCQVVEDLTPEQRLEIQIIEDSQEPIPEWESAEGIVKLYHQLEERRIRKSEKRPYSLKLYSARIGKGELKIKRAFWWQNCASTIKKAVGDSLFPYEFAAEFGRLDSKKRQEKEFSRLYQKKTTLKKIREHVNNILNPPKDEFALDGGFADEKLDKRIRKEIFAYMNPAIRALKTVYEIGMIEPEVRKLIQKKDVRKQFNRFFGTFSPIEQAINKESRYLQRLETKPPRELTLRERIYIGKYREMEQKAEKFVSRHNYSNKVKWIPFSKIEEDPENVRKTFSNSSLEELADSIRNFGIIHPILVEKQKNGKYKIVVGHRRSRGAKLAGMKKLRCLEISTLSADERLELQIAEDSQEPFSKDERAEAWKRLYQAEERKAMAKGLDYDVKKFASRIGKGIPTVKKAFSFLLLDDRVKSLVRERILKYGVGVEISYEENKEAQYWSALRAAVSNYTVKNTRDMIKSDKEKEKYILPSKWKKQIEKTSKRITLSTIVTHLVQILDAKNEYISAHFNLEDAKVRKKVFGWRTLIKKVHNMKKTVLKIREKFFK
ncbi:ParB/RepB/Spo0J family partition protein [Candidatus Woesearchaeota archaeon]|nr:ParB/RepB/Spo0J family partition protein [Candidatus Woesearchaeota archaeon]